MLPRPQRLNLKKDYKWASTGQVIQTSFGRLTLKYGDNNLPRVGITTSSKIFKKAYLRNRARRVLSRAFEDLIDQLPASINILALPNIRVLEVKSTELILRLKEELKKEGVIK